MHLDMSRNQFSGALPETLLDIDFSSLSVSSGPGLNLCWNRFDQPFGAELDEFLLQVHIAGHPTDCNNRQLTEIDPSISGSWYNRERPGKGYAIMLLDNGQLLHYWFGYPPAIDLFFDQQMWSLQMVAPEAEAAIYSPSIVPYGGRFSRGLGSGFISMYGQRKLEMVRLGDDSMSVLSGWRTAGRQVIISPVPPPILERFDHVRLTELAGTRCDNQISFQTYSGAWFNPEAAGEGFIVEALPDGRGVVYWFTYAADNSGSQVWMIGDGHFEGFLAPGLPPPGTILAQLKIEKLIMPVGTELGPDFDSEAVELVDWGSLKLEFIFGGTARVSWNSNIEAFGSGSYPLERLARPMLAQCD